MEFVCGVDGLGRMMWPNRGQRVALRHPSGRFPPDQTTGVSDHDPTSSHGVRSVRAFCAGLERARRSTSEGGVEGDESRLWRVEDPGASRPGTFLRLAHSAPRVAAVPPGGGTHGGLVEDVDRRSLRARHDLGIRQHGGFREGRRLSVDECGFCQVRGSAGPAPVRGGEPVPAAGSGGDAAEIA